MSSYPRFQSSYFNPLLAYFVILGLTLIGCSRKQDNTKDSSTKDPRSAALLYMSQNHFDDAKASFIKAIEATPDSVSNYVDLSRLYILQKNYSAAESQAKAGLKIKTDNAELRLILTEVEEQKGNREGAIRELREILEKDPKNVKALYQMAKLGPAEAGHLQEKQYLLKILSLRPANIVVRLQLAETFAGDGKADSSRFYLESVKKIAPDFSVAANASFQKALTLLQANQALQALPQIQQFHQLMKITPLYDSADTEIEMFEMVAGYPGFIVSQDEQISATNGDEWLKSITFTDASERVGLAFDKGLKAASSVLAIADREANGNLYVYESFVPAGALSSKDYLWVSKIGGFEKCDVAGGLDHQGQDMDAVFADYDNDGYQDLFITTTKGTIVFKNQGDGTFSRIKDDIGLSTAVGSKILFADFDQDGDLDMYVAQKGGNKFYRNNGDGTFTENTAAMGLTAAPYGSANIDFGDWDSDGDLDILALKPDGGIQLFNNNRHASFQDVSDAAGLRNSEYSGTAAAFGDYNNDGTQDIFIAGGPGGKCLLLKNTQDHGFVPDPASKMLSSSLKGIKVYDVAFLDFDNDGHLDILVAGINEDKSSKGVKLFHNDKTKGFSDVSYLLPKSVMQAHHAKVGDFDIDGDADIFLSGPSGSQLIRNDGGNSNHYIQVQLFGLSYGNSKNNRLGIGGQVEVKAGDLYQTRTVTSPLTEFGVGAHSKIDAVRIIWPNGVPQTIVDPGRKNRILEAEKLKGSCPFLFTWNGNEFEFNKDMMWRSALGMPVAVHGTDTTHAFSGPSKEYLLIPAEKLKPKNGLYTIKITEELWEAIFFDKISLTAIDHPDSVDTYVDERFVAPPYPGRKAYKVSGKYLPVSARDEKGNDLLPRISAYDFQYASNFSLGKFQGVAREHDLILNLGDKAKSDSLFLFLRGWLFPTDASINTELTQTNKYKVQPPYLQVINKKGKWQTVIRDLGFPMGRDKMVIANLSGKFLTANDRRVRIRTNMQLYWDHVFFSTGNSRAPLEMRDLKMVKADLGYRGYSASYRKGGPYGPEWFDYNKVTKGQKWRDLKGNYTRYGDVLPLLQKADDQYIIADGGDEVTIDFDAKQLPQLPKGWKRDFLIYSEGWVKDGDMNTAYGQTVGPLPFHAMPIYPYGKSVAFPDDKAHREYQQKYNTRKVTTFDFRNALRLSK